MAEYQVREEANGDLILTIAGEQKRLVARREIPGQAQTPVLLDGTLLTEGVLAGRLQVNCIKYCWPDGYEKWGPYLGSIHELESI